MQHLCILLAGLTLGQGEVNVNRSLPQLQTGRQFTAIMNKSFFATWENVELRQVIRRITEQQKVAILLDRRVNPQQTISLQANNQTLQEALEKIAAACHAEMVVVGHVVYIGPAVSTAKLRTLIALREEESRRVAARLPRSQRLTFIRKRTMHWNDLDTPETLLSNLLKAYKLKLGTGDPIPHDLWAGSTLPLISLNEALSLIAIQFDLTYKWDTRGQSISLVKIPERVSIEKTYRPRQMTAAAAVRAWTQKIPGLRANVKGNSIAVQGTIEEHEAVAALINPSRNTKPNNPPGPKVLPLNRREFTLKINKVPASALMKNLEQSGIRFEYNAQELAANKINLNQLISMDVKRASANEFFHAVYDQMGVNFQLSGVTVTLKPK